MNGGNAGTGRGGHLDGVRAGGQVQVREGVRQTVGGLVQGGAERGEDAAGDDGLAIDGQRAAGAVGLHGEQVVAGGGRGQRAGPAGLGALR